MIASTPLLLALLSISVPALGGSGDLVELCDLVDPDTGVPIRCAPRGSDVPVYDAPVCCDAATCYVADADPCPDSLQAYYCELGEVFASWEVACYFEVPDYCDLHPCAPGYQSQPQAFGMCCNAGVCWPYDLTSNDCELADIAWCYDGVCNDDGTVTCFD